MKNPLISIIIPVFNAEAYIRKSLESVLNQTYVNVEVICVNDGSTDNSLEILLAYEKFIQIINQTNRGAAAARNTGLKVAKGAFIKFWDSDDIMNETHIEAQYNAIADYPGFVASCKWGRFYNNDINNLHFKPETVWGNMSSIDWIEKALKQKGDMASSWLWLIPRNIIQKSGIWDERLTLNDDFEFSMRLLSQAKGVKFTENAIAYYRSGNIQSLASSTSHSSFRDALKSTQLGTNTILKMKATDEMKMLCANRYQEWIYRMYPNHLDLIKLAEQQIKSLGGSTKKMEGGRVFLIFRKIFGWKIAKRIQLLTYKIGYKPKSKF